MIDILLKKVYVINGYKNFKIKSYEHKIYYCNFDQRGHF